MTRRLGYISRVGRASRFLSLLPLDASVHQMPFYLKMYLNLLTDRIHVTSDRLHGTVTVLTVTSGANQPQC